MLLPTGVNTLTDNAYFAHSMIGRILQEMPLGFIDIGARGGAHDLIDPIARVASVLGFEPDAQECARLMGLKAVREPWADCKILPIALAETNRSAELVLMNEPNNHSLLPPNTAYTQRYEMTKWKEVGRHPLHTESLDNILFGDLATEKHWGEFIKIDTQGTEYKILQGAKRTLTERCVAVVTEVSFFDAYEGQALFSEVELLMREYGFAFYGFSKTHHRSKKLLDKTSKITRERVFYADAIFFKDPLLGLTHRKQLNERQRCVLITCTLLLGYYDFALELAIDTWSSSNPSELACIEKLIDQLSQLDASTSYQSVIELVNSVKDSPEKSNVFVGNFVDTRRVLCNYDDVLNVTPLPKTF
ncbi:MAG TPA: FkbM family methyltransferase [Gammaproteobacteria bacterium]|jgi:FkbM family methyltransferase|nr:FkbM family methyltransferase [Gammaproteobacteria bacterium]